MEEQAGSWDGNNGRVSGMAHGVLREQSQVIETSVANNLKLPLDRFEMSGYTIPCKMKLCPRTHEMRYQDG